MTTPRSTAAQLEARIALAGDLLAAGNSAAETAAALAEREGLSLRQSQRLTREAIARRRIGDLPRSEPASDWTPSATPASTAYGVMAAKVAGAIDKALAADDWKSVAALSSAWARLQTEHQRQQPLERFGQSVDHLRAADAIADLPADCPF
ncbi:hypothetical protein [Synechococcus sp. CBW1107]|uniref:hypothetical protein n=1 Tax=Synechococcus sp. CBW1107 TaxID=2789857 RepID=UPI002AD4ABF7|nr:hypothetical protein [Synechococcus sp. CBW1107]CAK6701026.1 hypothetical protein IFHNHDMJ_02985 [Synechococcus sp. CBW1107]